MILIFGDLLVCTPYTHPHDLQPLWGALRAQVLAPAPPLDAAQLGTCKPPPRGQHLGNLVTITLYIPHTI